MSKITINDLLNAGVHFGHQTRRRNPKMKPYIYGSRNGVNIFDLTVTVRGLAEACQFLYETTADNGNVLFVGTKRQAREKLREAAERTGMHHMCHRWLGGTLTNNKIILSRIGYMKKLQKMEADGVLETLPKKEVAGMRRERAKLERNLGGIANMSGLPAAVVIIDINREHIALREANKLGIPVVGLVDTNCDPDPVDYVIPGNDDALRSIELITDALVAAIGEGLAVLGKEVPEKAIPEGQETTEESEQAETASDAEAQQTKEEGTVETAAASSEQASNTEQTEEA